MSYLEEIWPTERQLAADLLALHQRISGAASGTAEVYLRAGTLLCLLEGFALTATGHLHSTLPFSDRARMPTPAGARECRCRVTAALECEIKRATGLELAAPIAVAGSTEMIVEIFKLTAPA